MISKNARIYGNVKLGKHCIIDDFVIIGIPFQACQDNPFETIIGDNAHIRSHTVIYAGNIIGNNFSTGHAVNIRECNKIGDNVSIGTHSVVEHHIKIEDGVRIHSNVFIPEYSVFETKCWIGPNVVFTNAKYPNSSNAKKELKGVCINKHAVIGANSTLLPGITIGEYALVGAGSMVTKSVADKQVVAGNPAKIINNIENLPYRDAF